MSENNLKWVCSPSEDEEIWSEEIRSKISTWAI